MGKFEEVVEITNAEYYTPDVSEFHVGFECEIQTSYGYIPGVFPSVFDEDTHTQFFKKEYGYDLERMIKASTWRVKKLDRKDLVDLNWSHMHDDCFELLEENVPPKWRMSFGINGHLHIYHKYVRNGYLNTVFKGKLRNKSELLKVMRVNQLIKS